MTYMYMQAYLVTIFQCITPVDYTDAHLSLRLQNFAQIIYFTSYLQNFIFHSASSKIYIYLCFLYFFCLQSWIPNLVRNKRLLCAIQSVITVSVCDTESVIIAIREVVPPKYLFTTIYFTPYKFNRKYLLNKRPRGLVVCQQHCKKSAINVSENVYLYSKMHYHEKMYILYINHWHLYYYVRSP